MYLKIEGKFKAIKKEAVLLQQEKVYPKSQAYPDNWRAG